MGKRKKLNRLISRWIKSDLPDDRGPVLLLAVTRIPTSPKPFRRPISLPVGSPALPADQQSSSIHQRRNSGSSRRESLRRNSTRKKEVVVKQQQAPKFVVTPCLESVVNSTPSTAVFDLSSECSSSLVASDVSGGARTPTPSDSDGLSDLRGGRTGRVDSVMDRSVDSIGTCSLDVDASVAESSDWSEVSSVGTLRSACLPTPSPEPRLPSYLSLACTVNGYSTTTNYDPDRLARSRDSSPHRPPQHHAQDNLTTYTIHNNLLSPPNLVPLPPVVKKINPNSNKMSENGTTMSTTHYRQEFYNNVLTSSYIKTSTTEKSNKTVVSSRDIFSSDSVDSCIGNGYKENKTVVETKKLEEITTNGIENKSFIQQRVERLYGPGALAQGFFVMKRQKNSSFRAENLNGKTVSEKHSKSMNDQEIADDLDNGMKQSTSSPSLPVLRHLRPEFRAQLPIIASKKVAEGPMQKSVTVPALAEDNMNGYSTNAAMSCGFIVDSRKAEKKVANGDADVCDRIEPHHVEHISGAKDGHHFIKVMEKEAKRLLLLADMADEEHETPDLPEDAKGYLRSAAGKARLLVTQKMQQFKGLCRNNISQVSGEAFPTTNEDLQGFWDMIMLQVDQIDNLFRDLDTLRDNDWQEQKPVMNGASKPRKVVKVPSRPLSAVAEENRKLREAQRKKMIEEKRRLMKEQQQKSKMPRQSIEIYVPESS